MKPFPDVHHSFADLLDMLFGPLRAKLLLTGIELKVFNQLSQPTSAKAVAQALGAHPRTTEVFLDSLTAINLLQKQSGLYRTTPVTQAFLEEASPTYLGTFLQMVASQLSIEHLPQLIRDGPSPLPETTFAEELYAQEYASLERAGYAQLMAEVVADLPEFPSFRKLLDLGGGPGLVGMAVVAAHPRMHGVIFDLPPMVKVAETFIQAYGMTDRVEVLGGDGFRDSIGDGYDLVLVCNSLQGFKDQLDVVMKKVFDALTPNGVCISIYFGLTHERTQPELCVLSLLSMALAGYDTGFDQGFIATSMLRAGFTSVRSRTLPTPMGPMELDIARKKDEQR